MKKYLYITSGQKEMTYCIVYGSKEEALKSSGIKRMSRVEIDIPDIEETTVIAEEEEFTKED